MPHQFGFGLVCLSISTLAASVPAASTAAALIRDEARRSAFSMEAPRRKLSRRAPFEGANYTQVPPEEVEKIRAFHEKALAMIGKDPEAQARVRARVAQSSLPTPKDEQSREKAAGFGMAFGSRFAAHDTARTGNGLLSPLSTFQFEPPIVDGDVPSWHKARHTFDSGPRHGHLLDENHGVPEDAKRRPIRESFRGLRVEVPKTNTESHEGESLVSDYNSVLASQLASHLEKLRTKEIGRERQVLPPPSTPQPSPSRGNASPQSRQGSPRASHAGTPRGPSRQSQRTSAPSKEKEVVYDLPLPPEAQAGDEFIPGLKVIHHIHTHEHTHRHIMEHAPQHPFSRYDHNDRGFLQSFYDFAQLHDGLLHGDRGSTYGHDWHANSTPRSHHSEPSTEPRHPWPTSRRSSRQASPRETQDERWLRERHLRSGSFAFDRHGRD